MHPRISIDGLSSWQWDIARDLALAKALGAGPITVAYSKIAGDVPAGVAAIRASGLAPIMLAGGTATGLLGGVDSICAPIEAAAAMECPGFYTVSGATPKGASTDEAFAALVDAVGPQVDHAASRGVRFAIEHTSTASRGFSFLHSFADACDLSRETGIGIVVELQNIWYERRLPQLFREHVGRIALVQVSDFTIGEDIRMNRRVPGDGDIPLDWLIGRLLDAGYGGLLDIEVLGPHIEAEGYACALRRSVDWLAGRLTRWGV